MLFALPQIFIILVVAICRSGVIVVFIVHVVFVQKHIYIFLGGGWWTAIHSCESHTWFLMKDMSVLKVIYT